MAMQPANLQSQRWAGRRTWKLWFDHKACDDCVLRQPFMRAVRFPKEDRKRRRKALGSRGTLLKAWHMVGACDETLILLYDQPHWYGESYFDRKCNYSLDIRCVGILHNIWFLRRLNSFLLVRLSHCQNLSNYWLQLQFIQEGTHTLLCGTKTCALTSSMRLCLMMDRILYGQIPRIPVSCIRPCIIICELINAMHLID